MPQDVYKSARWALNVEERGNYHMPKTLNGARWPIYIPWHIKEIITSHKLMIQFRSLPSMTLLFMLSASCLVTHLFLFYLCCYWRHLSYIWPEQPGTLQPQEKTLKNYRMCIKLLIKILIYLIESMREHH